MLTVPPWHGLEFVLLSRPDRDRYPATVAFRVALSAVGWAKVHAPLPGPAATSPADGECS